MDIKRISPEEAHRLMSEEGYVYVDVRSVPEFEAGHPAGAYNIPLHHKGPSGMIPNPDFLEVVERVLPPGSKIVLGCRSGGRSMAAARQMQSAGYGDLVELRAGFGGSKDPFGQVIEAGWQDAGLPISQEAEEGRAYAELSEKRAEGR